MVESGTPEPYWTRLKRLREAAGLSQPELFFRSGVSIGTIRGLEQPYQSQKDGRTGSSRYPSLETIERLSQALGVEPDEWPEYRLAHARKLLDDREIGLPQAIANLDRITAALERRAGRRSAMQAEQTAERQRTLRAILGEQESPQVTG